MDSKAATRTGTKEILKEYDFSFLKRFGQNFLVDKNVLQKIVDAAEVSEDDVVLEVGPGIGTLTAELAARACRVIAVEIDERLMMILEDTLKDYANVILIHQDIMKTDIPALIDEYKGDHTFKVVANLPYYITTPLVMRLLGRALPIDSLTVMIQKEVADRMQAQPGSKDYGSLTLAVQYYAVPEVVAQVSPESFIPRPKVGSAIVRLKRFEEPPVKVKDPDFMFHLIRATFQKRRKTLLNSLTNTSEVSLDREKVAEAIKALDLPPAVRGETLTLSQFAALSDLLCEV